MKPISSTPVLPALAVFTWQVPAPEVPGRDAKKPQVLILTGSNVHDWRAISEAVCSTPEETGRFGVRVNEGPACCTEKTFDGSDAIVLNFTNHAGVFGPKWPEDTRRALL